MFKYNAVALHVRYVTNVPINQKMQLPVNVLGYMPRVSMIYAVIENNKDSPEKIKEALNSALRKEIIRITR